MTPPQPQKRGGCSDVYAHADGTAAGHGAQYSGPSSFDGRATKAAATETMPVLEIPDSPIPVAKPALTSDDSTSNSEYEPTSNEDVDTDSDFDIDVDIGSVPKGSCVGMSRLAALTSRPIAGVRDHFICTRGQQHLVVEWGGDFRNRKSNSTWEVAWQM